MSGLKFHSHVMFVGKMDLCYLKYFKNISAQYLSFFAINC